MKSKGSINSQSRTTGQTLVEYALILAFISVVAIYVLQALGSKVTSVFSTINKGLSTAQSSS
jgi:Flp pilus assembly pilin Flp